MFLKFIKKILPRELHSDFETVIIDNPSKVERHKYFPGGPGTYHFEFVCHQDNEFLVWVGKAMGGLGRFAGSPTPKIRVAGEDERISITLEGSEFNMEKADYWLVKVRAVSFCRKHGDRLDIYMTRKE